MLSRRTAIVIATVDVLTALLVAFGVFVGLPTRWWPVDTGAVLLMAIDLAAGIGLFAATPWAVRVARIAGLVSLALGLFTVTVLALTASWLSGVYGPVGHGGAIVLGLVALLVFPYLVVAPVVQLLWLRPTAERKPMAPGRV
ncbi:MAG TPA: hypothetical protein VGM06_08075 [Polyangiaceae bacterium]|jgi:hypothetical protein